VNTAAMFGIPDYEFRVVFGRTCIDYGINKEASNRKKHKYSLQSAVYILESIIFPFGCSRPYAVSNPYSKNGETRHMHMSVDDVGSVVLMVTTMRNNETIRVISYRPASEVEKLQFKELTGYIETNKKTDKE